MAIALVVGATALSAGASPPPPSQVGQFGSAFEEPGPRCIGMAPNLICKPVGAAVVVLADGRVLYWNNLEGAENLPLSIVTEGGVLQANDQSRVMDLRSGAPTWITPQPNRGTANPPPAGGGAQYLIPG